MSLDVPAAMKIMIVDDNSEMRALIRRMLGDLAEEIQECGDGQSALAHYEEQGPDWSVVDVGMPGIDGLAVTSRIKSRHPEAQIVIITESSNAQMKAVAFQNGATAFVPKENLLELRTVIVGQRDQASSRSKEEQICH